MNIDCIDMFPTHEITEIICVGTAAQKRKIARQIASTGKYVGFITTDNEIRRLYVSDSESDLFSFLCETSHCVDVPTYSTLTAINPHGKVILSLYKSDLE